MVELDRILVSIPDNGMDEEGWQWAKIVVLMRDQATGENPSVEASVHIRIDDNRTVRSAKLEAKVNAIRAISQALQFLEASMPS